MLATLEYSSNSEISEITSEAYYTNIASINGSINTKSLPYGMDEHYLINSVEEDHDYEFHHITMHKTHYDGGVDIESEVFIMRKVISKSYSNRIIAILCHN